MKTRLNAEYNGTNTTYLAHYKSGLFGRWKPIHRGYDNYFNPINYPRRHTVTEAMRDLEEFKNSLD